MSAESPSLKDAILPPRGLVTRPQNAPMWGCRYDHQTEKTTCIDCATPAYGLALPPANLDHPSPVQYSVVERNEAALLTRLLNEKS